MNQYICTKRNKKYCQKKYSNKSAMDSFTSKKRSSVGSTRRRMSGKKLSDTSNAHKVDSFSDTESDETRINYQDEIVLVFFNSMLEIIVKEWKPIPSEIGPICTCRNLTIGEIRDDSIASAMETDETLSQESKLSARRESVGSAKSSKSGRKDSLKRRLSKISEKSIPSNFNNSRTSTKKSANKISVGSGENTVESSLIDWMIYPQIENVKITFRNGNVYEGPTLKKLMHGYGKYTWADGTLYEGDFEHGFATGHGNLRYSNLTTYHGEFCKSILHGYGKLNIFSSPMTYCGYWKNGQKHGSGWMLYDSDCWYDGNWCEDLRHGKGTRNYKTGEKYHGNWCNGLQDGNGTFVWNNNDVYTGEWKEGKMHGYGEYTWNAFLNKTLSFPVQNIYKGYWENGFRNGTGILDFGFDTGARLASVFRNNEKQGAGILVCGNGFIVQQHILFLNDNLVVSDENRAVTPVDSSKNPNTDKIRTSFRLSNLTSAQNQQIVERQSLSQLQRNPLNSVHAPPEDTDFSYYVDLAVQEYTSFLFKDQLTTHDLEITASSLTHADSHRKQFSGTENNHYVLNYYTLLTMYELQQTEIEKKHLKDAIITHLSHIHKLYKKYATIATHQKVEFQPILIRFFLWQLIRDIKFCNTRHSLIDFDYIIFKNPNCGMELAHAPFEKIFFWQFLQILVCFAWEFHSANNVDEECKNCGILATLLVHFLNDLVYPNTRITKSYSLFEFRDLLPLNSVYKFYKSIGEPHTARKFLNLICIKKNQNPPHCFESSHEHLVADRSTGVNIVPSAGNVIYLEDKNVKFGSNQNEESTEPCKNQLFALRTLGPKRVMKCLISVCPHIACEDVIVNVEYPLTFLEFYDTLLMCTFRLVDIKRQRMEKIRLSQDIQLQLSTKEIGGRESNIKHTSSKSKRSSKSK